MHPLRGFSLSLRDLLDEFDMDIFTFRLALCHDFTWEIH
jgi:hypothetical protein